MEALLQELYLRKGTRSSISHLSLTLILARSLTIRCRANFAALISQLSSSIVIACSFLNSFCSPVHVSTSDLRSLLCWRLSKLSFILNSFWNNLHNEIIHIILFYKHLALFWSCTIPWPLIVTWSGTTSGPSTNWWSWTIWSPCSVPNYGNIPSSSFATRSPSPGTTMLTNATAVAAAALLILAVCITGFFLKTHRRCQILCYFLYYFCLVLSFPSFYLY
jgi:hypothetical protein